MAIQTVATLTRQCTRLQAESVVGCAMTASTTLMARIVRSACPISTRIQISPVTTHKSANVRVISPYILTQERNPSFIKNKLPYILCFFFGKVFELKNCVSGYFSRYLYYFSIMKAVVMFICGNKSHIL